ncbi:MAG: HAD family hydrolase [Fimbriimonadaceae bacterium]
MEEVKRAGIKAVLWDVDGTLVDSLAPLLKSLRAAIATVAAEPTDADLKPLIGMPLRQQVLHFAPELPPNQVDAVMELALNQFSQNKHLQREFAAAIDGLVLCHKAGLANAVVTSKNSVELERFMVGFRAARYVDVTICADDVANPKPHPDAALKAIEILGCTNQEAIFIGDSVFDARCALSAGIPFVAVSYGAGESNALLSAGAEQVLATPHDVHLFITDLIRTNAWQERSQPLT